MAYLSDNVDALYSELDSYFRDSGLLVVHGEVKTGQTRVDISDISDVKELLSFADSHNDGFVVFGDFAFTETETLEWETFDAGNLSLTGAESAHIWKFSMSFVYGGICYRFMATCEEFLQFVEDMDERLEDERANERLGEQALIEFVRRETESLTDMVLQNEQLFGLGVTEVKSMAVSVLEELLEKYPWDDFEEYVDAEDVEGLVAWIVDNARRRVPSDVLTRWKASTNLAYNSLDIGVESHRFVDKFPEIADATKPLIVERIRDYLIEASGGYGPSRNYVETMYQRVKPLLKTHSEM